MALSTDTINKLAADLHTAEQTKVSIAPLTETNPDIDVSDAYGVQLEGVRLRTGGDSKQILGWKVGLTSAAVPQPNTEATVRPGQPGAARALAPVNRRR